MGITGRRENLHMWMLDLYDICIQVAALGTNTLARIGKLPVKLGRWTTTHRFSSTVHTIATHRDLRQLHQFHL